MKASMSTSASASKIPNKKNLKKSRALNFLHLDLAEDQIAVLKNTECYQNLISLSSVDHVFFCSKQSSNLARTVIEFNNSFIVGSYFIDSWKFAQNTPNTFSDGTSVSRAISINTATVDREVWVIS